MQATDDSPFADAPVPLAVVAIQSGVLREIVTANDAFSRLVCVPAEHLPGRELSALLHSRDAELLGGTAVALLTDQFQVRVLRDGHDPVWAMLSLRVAGSDPGLERATAVVSLQDVTHWRQVEEELAHRATHDALTGLANRSMLMGHLERALARLGRRSGSLAVLFCDLDGFKTLNDTFGHRAGDAVLRSVAKRILGAVRAEDVVVRVGGDEFVIVCEATDPREPGQVAERVRSALEAPLQVSGRDLTVGVSIGVAQASENSGSPEDLVRRADLAMYRAKQLGRNRVEVFNPELEEHARSRIEMVEQVRTALLGGGVVIDLQPVVDLGSGAWVGSEALARIRQPDGHRLLPPQFMSTARSAGLIERLDGQVRSQALDWLAARSGSGGASAPLWVSVNVSARELGTAQFAAAVQSELADHGLDPSRLMLELAESAIAEMQGPVLATLRRLRTIGCRIAIDDFGSGNSGLTSLRDLGSDVVKIDRSFIAGLGHDAHDEAIVEAIISVSHRLGRRVVAKGIESPGQADLLRSLGCDMGQGYLFGPPEPPGGTRGATGDPGSPSNG